MLRRQAGNAGLLDVRRAGLIVGRRGQANSSRRIDPIRSKQDPIFI